MIRYKYRMKDISSNIKTKKSWHEFVRKKEIKLAFSFLKKDDFNRGLEIGAGDGGQSSYILNVCKSLVCTDIDESSHSWLGGDTLLKRNVKNIEYKVCDAQNLSCFENESFDFIYSSNVLEHIPDINKCLSEFRRVLTSDGVMVHMMPSRWWKFFNFVLFILKCRKPLIHGEFSSHLKEFKAFGVEEWKGKFISMGYNVSEIGALPFYVGHGHHFSIITKFGNLIGLPGSYVYIVRKS